MVVNSNPVEINGETYNVTLVMIIENLKIVEGKLLGIPVGDNLDESNVLSDIFTADTLEARRATTQIMQILQNYIVEKNT
jgi:hypothetical protein